MTQYFILIEPMVLHGVRNSFSPTQEEGEERERERESTSQHKGADWHTVHVGHHVSTYRVIG